MNEYGKRDATLKVMGFRTYGLYLQSPIWQSIRTKVLKSCDNKCVVCKSQATEVHHLSYDLDVLCGNRNSMLAPLCRDCHRLIEFEGDIKRTFSQSVVKYNELTQNRGNIQAPPEQRRTKKQIKRLEWRKQRAREQGNVYTGPVDNPSKNDNKNTKMARVAECLSKSVAIENLCRQYGIKFRITNNGANWIFRRGKTQADWWPSVCRFASKRPFSDNCHVDCAEKALIEIQKTFT